MVKQVRQNLQKTTQIALLKCDFLWRIGEFVENQGGEVIRLGLWESGGTYIIYYICLLRRGTGKGKHLAILMGIGWGNFWRIRGIERGATMGRRGWEMGTMWGKKGGG